MQQRHLDNEVSHDQITRFLKNSEFTSKDIFYVVIANNLKFKYVLMDIWFASTENSEYIANKNKEFIVAII